MLFHWGYVIGVLISSTEKSVFQNLEEKKKTVSEDSL